METLSTILHILLYVVGILGLLVVIYALIGGTINNLTANKRKEKAIDEAIKFIKAIQDVEKETKETKKKTTKKTTKNKENE